MFSIESQQNGKTVSLNFKFGCSLTTYSSTSTEQPQEVPSGSSTVDYKPFPNESENE